MSDVEARLRELKIELPTPAKPAANYVPIAAHDACASSRTSATVTGYATLSSRVAAALKYAACGWWMTIAAVDCSGTI
jgi:hypothetical protein